MGYYSTFNLTLIGKDNPTISKETVNKIVNDLEIMGILESALNENLESADAVKWYSVREDMCFLSSRHPDIIFSLRIDGEESGDISMNYFFEGKYHVSPAKIYFDPFDFNKLNEINFSSSNTKFNAELAELDKQQKFEYEKLLEQQKIEDEKQKALGKLSDHERSILGL